MIFIFNYVMALFLLGCAAPEEKVDEEQPVTEGVEIDASSQEIWVPLDLDGMPGFELRFQRYRITAGEGVTVAHQDGVDYECAAEWTVADDRAEWKCQDLAPIPGRESRDMKRKDYDSLDRLTHIVAFPASGAWVERQENVKIAAGNKLATENGRSWYVRVPDAQCTEAKEFADAREKLWRLSRRTWEQFLAAQDTFKTTSEQRGKRFAGLHALEERWVKGQLGEAEARKQLEELIRQ